MTKGIMMLTLLTGLFFISCNETPKKEKSEMITTEAVADSTDAVVTATSIGNDGKMLEMVFNNTKEMVTLNFEGETIQLPQQRAASGIWYKNDTYELRGKGNDMTLTKDGVIIFEHKDDMVEVEAKNGKGDVLNMTFNNTQGTVKAYLNGGAQIDLVEKKAASGIWYNNDAYELSGKGDKYILKKEGAIVFEN